MLSDRLDSCRTEIGRRKPIAPHFPADKIITDLPQSVGNDFSYKLKEVLVEMTTESWMFWYGLLVDYHAEHGDCLVKDTYKIKDNYKLSSWVVVQRTRKDRLAKERVKKLNSLGFNWDPHTTQWEEGYSYLKAYHADTIISTTDPQNCKE